MTNVYAAFKKLKIFYCHEMDCMKTIIQIPQNRAGVYLLKEKGIVVYVGRSKDVLTRLGAHAFKVYDEVEFYARGSTPRSAGTEDDPAV